MKTKSENKRRSISWWLFVAALFLVFLLLIILFRDGKYFGKKSGQFGVISERGVIDAFQNGLTDCDGNIVFCGASAIAYDGRNLIFGSDRPVPGDSIGERSPVFTMEYAGFPSAEITYYTAPAFIEATKYEDFTVTPDRHYVIATTGFDRVHDTGSSAWDNYNTMLFWPIGKPDEVKVVSACCVDGVTSSVVLRSKISSVLRTEEFPDGVPYFKIEGLAAIPGNTLLLGIRELGADYEVFDYAIKIISVSYHIVKGDLILSDDYRLIYDYDPGEKLAELGGCTVGLSSIEFDKFHHRLYLLTSYEVNNDEEITDEDIGAFLWVLPLNDLKTKKAPEIVVKRSDSTPLMFAHKGEGIAVINSKRLIIIHDDDFVLGREKIANPETQFSRQPNQAAYTVVEFVE